MALIDGWRCGEGSGLVESVLARPHSKEADELHLIPYVTVCRLLRTGDYRRTQARMKRTIQKTQPSGAPQPPFRHRSLVAGFVRTLILFAPIGFAACLRDPGPARQEEAVVAPSPFSVGPYQLEAPVAGLKGLVEWSGDEYKSMGRQFHGEKNFHAPPVMFMGRQWKLIVGTVDGKIYKLAPHTQFTDKLAALQTLEATLRFYRENVGEPAKPQPGLYIWDVPEANVIVQTAEASDGFGIGLFVTAGSARTRATIPQ